MIKKIIGTTGARLFNAILSFLIVLLNTNYLGAEGFGTISLIILNISIVLIFNDLIGGTLIYYASRISFFRLLIPAYIWSLITAALITTLLHLIAPIPPYSFHIFALSLIYALGSINLNYLLGRERISQYNLITVMQFSVIIMMLMCFFYLLGRVSVMSYIYSLYSGYMVTFVLSLFLISRYKTKVELKSILTDVSKVLQFGFYSQSANILQLLNRRLSYFYLEFLVPNGRYLLGIFSAGVQLSEGVWLLGKSVSLVQFTRIANTNDQEYAKKLTLSLLKFTFLVTLLFMAILLLLPADFYSFLFGKDFTAVKQVIILLCLGILAISVSMMFSHYYSGTGRPKYNMYSSLSGFLFTAILGYALIPKYGLAGAAVITSISYVCATVYQLIVFIKISKTRMKEFLINSDDIRVVRGVLRNILNY